MKCPYCNGEILLTVISDMDGKILSSEYACNLCKRKLDEEKILELTTKEKG